MKKLKRESKVKLDDQPMLPFELLLSYLTLEDQIEDRLTQVVPDYRPL